ncbi:hypothetical protein V5799_018034 [Amblyomma americanum]|uniref:Uncharacterized protein n=1 Tax=Amblyomma americanum TaxID=6943 RepID=A0AAQ4F1E7_AMBAM
MNPSDSATTVTVLHTSQRALGMHSFKRFNIIFTVAALATVITVPCFCARDCRQNPRECGAMQVLSDFAVLDELATSDLEPSVYCDMYEKLSLSEDGTKAQYTLVYRNVGDTTPFKLENSDTQHYYLLANPDSDISEYQTCFNKIDAYSGGIVNSMRDDDKCKTVPRKLH